MKAAAPPEHEWVALHDSLIVVPTIQAPQDRSTWKLMDPEGILERLEREAVTHGLMEPGDPPLVDPWLAIAQLWKLSRGLKGVARDAAA